VTVGEQQHRLRPSGKQEKKRKKRKGIIGKKKPDEQRGESMRLDLDKKMK